VGAGKSLNLTALSVFIGLVLWGSIWGICGAILSVPLLGATKVLLDDADYPLAKQVCAAAFWSHSAHAQSNTWTTVRFLIRSRCVCIIIGYAVDPLSDQRR
jgi:hypothetical protein